MDVNQGLARRLPAPIPPDQKVEDKDINKRNLLVVKINSANQLMVQGQLMDVKQLRENAKKFIKNEENADYYPKLFEEDFGAPFGVIKYTKDHVISVQNDVDTRYQAYLDVQNELVAAYNELREECAQKYFHKAYNELEEKRSILRRFPRLNLKITVTNMAKIRRNEKREMPALNTSSLPDIIFMLLFFFMSVTSMKEVSYKVQFQNPQATELTKLENKSLVRYIYVGTPTAEFRKQYGAETRIQLNDQFAEVKEIGEYIVNERSSMKESDQGLMTVSIKADKETRMGVIADIKQELRRAYALKISYAATQRTSY